MFSSFRGRFGIPGVISVIALVFAMFGGAYAATNGNPLASAHHKKSKAKRGPRGPRGKAGPVGPAGPAGPAGKDGAQGPKGDTGPVGPKGDKGDKGDPGEEGSPWTDGGTLPEEATETGVWGPSTFGGAPKAPAGESVYPISFPIPLASPPDLVVVKSEEDKSAAGCSGEVGNVGSIEGGTPVADPGKLCVYLTVPPGFAVASTITAVDPSAAFAFGGHEGVGTSGALLKVSCAAECVVQGVWAVTGD